MKRLHIADTDEVKAGDVTDVYFVRTEKVLRAKHQDKHVCMEVFLKSFPDSSYRWGVFAGLEEVSILLEGRPITLRSIPEGSIFFADTPVMSIEGNYLDFGSLETAILGCVCQASGIATRAARCRIACGNKTMISFGARRMHPSIAPMVERAAFIGGCDGVAAVASARLIGEKPIGTMPHALILQMGDTLDAALAFDEIIEKDVLRVVLIDTLQDEKFETIRIAEAMGKRLFGVRLDTPSSRRGNFRRLLKEVRWELDTRGFNHVKLFVSGGLNEESILEINDIADSFGVGTRISSAASLDFSMDIVAIENRAFAKRGKDSGKKSVLRCKRCMKDYVVPFGQERQCECGGLTSEILMPVIEDGELVADLPNPREIRAHAMEELGLLVKDSSPKDVLNI
ncbi:MAG: nicotinate phosphoribosyltransferase [Thermodesulfobacteriota bacterium]|nr:nicotinate phosphoribosyltransferase [Thermodesulfobacteriota bacterium]